MKGSDERLLGVRLMSKDLSTVYASSGASGIQKENEGVASRIQTMVDAAGKPVWIPGLKKGFFESFNEPTITMGRVLQNLKRPEAEFILLIEIKDKAILNTLSNLKIGKSGEVRVITPDNVIVHSADKELIESKSFIGLTEDQLKSGDASFTTADEKELSSLLYTDSCKP